MIFILPSPKTLKSDPKTEDKEAVEQAHALFLPVCTHQRSQAPLDKGRDYGNRDLFYFVKVENKWFCGNKKK